MLLHSKLIAFAVVIAIAEIAVSAAAVDDDFVVAVSVGAVAVVAVAVGAVGVVSDVAASDHCLNTSTNLQQKLNALDRTIVLSNQNLANALLNAAVYALNHFAAVGGISGLCYGAMTTVASV